MVGPVPNPPCPQVARPLGRAPSFYYPPGPSGVVGANGSIGDEDIERYLAKLVEALRLLAADYDTQVSVLPPFVDVPSEVASTFGDDAFVLADQVVKAGRITREQYAKMKEIDDVLAEMSRKKHAELWSLGALRDRPEWHRVRAMAREALVSLGTPLRSPDLSWVAYVPGRQGSGE